ncbi:MAG: substrate-binding domain-containing protein [Alphaproteobacteria bacterium]
MSKISLKLLSEHLGLTEGTVSRAINDYPDISSRTRDKVKQAARELGYSPNSNARRLATGNAECIGYVLPWQTGHISDPFLGELLDGISRAVSVRHWDLTLAVSGSARDELSVISRLSQSGRVNGLIISRTLIHDPRIEYMQKLGIPFVTHGRTANSENHAWFDIDNVAAFREAVAHLAGLGHRRIAHIKGPVEYNFAAMRQAGYRKGLLDCNLTSDTALETEADMTERGGYRAMRHLLSHREPPTAVICVSDIVALGAMKAIHEAGWHPGREVSVIGYDGLSLGEHTHPALTTMVQPLQTAGKRIAEMLLAIIDGENPRDHQELRRATLERRETDGPPPGRPPTRNPETNFDHTDSSNSKPGR